MGSSIRLPPNVGTDVLFQDLASLLKALYDAVGSSIRLPPNGAKTLKLRLTVGQDRTQIHAISTTGKALTGGKRKENG